ncbi:sigma factor G inhibitor Gin [uncultured Clostridium sp.]|uniref:sigma factor G inhibitor Gin n=1 Tax=uncultured Clostridium sp. TaxID=59620 RepID=UPI0028E50BDB|nr:sigma factor G inhibitor Gin [uncultured Clostridium sp.]
MKRQCCIICGKPLNRGIILNGKGICQNCEEKMVNVRMDTDFYLYYKNCIKKYLTYSMLRGEDNRCQNYHL